MEDAELKKAGLKVTLPRLKILQILESQPEASQHMSAEDVYRALLEAGEDVGLAVFLAKGNQRVVLQPGDEFIGKGLR